MADKAKTRTESDSLLDEGRMKLTNRHLGMKPSGLSSPVLQRSKDKGVGLLS